MNSSFDDWLSRLNAVASRAAEEQAREFAPAVPVTEAIVPPQASKDIPPCRPAQAIGKLAAGLATIAACPATPKPDPGTACAFAKGRIP